MTSQCVTQFVNKTKEYQTRCSTKAPRPLSWMDNCDAPTVSDDSIPVNGDLGYWGPGSVVLRV